MSTCPDAVVRCDPDRLRQVLANLLSHAEKYSPPGSLIKVEVFRRPGTPAVPAPTDRPRAGSPGEVWVAVRDYGYGVPEDRRSEIFEPFRQGGPVSAGSGPSAVVTGGATRPPAPEPDVDVTAARSDRAPAPVDPTPDQTPARTGPAGAPASDPVPAWTTAGTADDQPGVATGAGVRG